MKINAGTTLRFINYDSTGHLVHADSTAVGFPHQNVSVPMGLGQEYVVTPSAPGVVDFSCHLHGDGSMGETTLTVQ
jgi:plastocyanin